MRAMKIAKSALILLLAAGLFACGQQDWRKQAIADAEAKMRIEVSDPAAKFSDVQVTGDDTTGQICGSISAKLLTGGERTARFIVYIDNTSGPYVEGNIGVHPVSDDRFVFAWQNDCVKEGYKE
ncbi:MAG TPA: hypothetical protein VGH02_07570 [Rhizomicrobium sp.]|jgi:hypothetical protein